MTDTQQQALFLTIFGLIIGGASFSVGLWVCKTEQREQIKIVSVPTKPIEAPPAVETMPGPNTAATTQEPALWGVPEDYAAARIESGFDAPGLFTVPPIKLLLPYPKIDED